MQVHILEKLLPDIIEPSDHLKNELSMFRAIIKSETKSLEALALTFADDKGGRSDAALFRCLDYLSRQNKAVYEMNIEEMNRLLRILYLFGVTYRKITRLPQLETSRPIQRALGFHVDESGLEASILATSFLARIESISPLVMRKNDRNEMVVNARQLGIRIANLLDSHLVSVLSHHAVVCFGAKSFGPICFTCLDGRQSECQCHRHHVKGGDVPAFHNQQIQLYLLQVLVLRQGEPYDWIERRDQRNKYLRPIFDILFPLHEAAGNLANFTSREPRVSDGIVVLREWLQESMCNLNVKSPSLMLKTLLMASALGIEYRPDSWKGILGRVPRTEEGYRVDVEGKQQPLFLDLINTLFRSAEGSVEQGIGFLVHVITKRVRIDPHALVTFLEVFTTIFVGCLRQGRMDQIVLPRSFLFYLAKRSQLPTADLWAIAHLLGSLPDLVEAIYSGQDEFRDLSLSSRGRIISRIYRCLVIIGCNSGSTIFQSQVRRSISALRKDREDRQFRSCYLGYLTAGDWEELATAAYESLSDCAVDKMVRTVRLIQGQDAPYPSDGPMVLQFTTELSLFTPYILSPLITDIRKSKLRATAKSFIPRASAVSATVTRAPSPALNLNEQALMNRGTVEPVATISVEDLEASATPEEIKAATVIQVAYRRALRRRAAFSPKDERVKFWYDQCLDAQTRLQGPRVYSKYFLGPLVHVLIWADSLVRLFKNRKERVKKRFQKNSDHMKIEDFMERLTVCGDNYKRGVQLQRSLLPKAGVHRRGQIQELRGLVSDLKGLTEELKLVLEDSEEHLRLGQRGILPAKPKRTETKPLKPLLNTDDLFDL